MILPGATLGVLGGGQLGRMFTMAARTMGYRVIVLDSDPHSPAGDIADQHIQSDYHDQAALDMLGDACAAVTTEFENVSAASLERLLRHCPVRPSPAAVALAQDRIREKTFLAAHGLPTVPFHAVLSEDDVHEGMRKIGAPALLKTAALGYDGKGQVPVDDADAAVQGFRSIGEGPCVLERRLTLAKELSVILARSLGGEIAVYPVAENIHDSGILDISLVPARVEEQIAEDAIAMACDLAEDIDYCGVLAIEFFLSTNGELLINEIAPRPHNSGHCTVDACLTSQFEQQVRMLCGLSPGDTQLLSPVVMVNLLGDLWNNGDPPWEVLFRHPAALLHLYGKRHARPGRKMGHFNCLAPTLKEALQVAEKIRGQLAQAAR
jgi:5-(carboxyamino)imidazole ribonucleotide synthase